MLLATEILVCVLAPQPRRLREVPQLLPRQPQRPWPLSRHLVVPALPSFPLWQVRRQHPGLFLLHLQLHWLEAMQQRRHQHLPPQSRAQVVLLM